MFLFYEQNCFMVALACNLLRLYCSISTVQSVRFASLSIARLALLPFSDDVIAGNVHRGLEVGCFLSMCKIAL